MSLTIQSLIMQHRCEDEPSHTFYGKINLVAARWSATVQEAFNYAGSDWLYCPYCKAPLPQNHAEAIKAVA